MDANNKEINQIFTMVSQIKGILTKTLFQVLPTFAPIYTTYLQHTYLIFDPNLDLTRYLVNKLQNFTFTLYPT